MSQPHLFELPPDHQPTPAPLAEPRGRPRFQRPERHQAEYQMVVLDELLADDHQARGVWAFVEASDLTPLYDRIKAVEGHVGRNPVDPRILVALWLHATIDGVGSARQLERLCGRDVVYRWLCGGVSVNHHLLADFRTRHVAWLDTLLTASVAALMNENLVTLNRVAQDGMRVRAAAGQSSFRRQPTLEQHLATAGEQVERLRKELGEDPGASDRQGDAARKRAAEERQERVRQALVEVAKVATTR